MKIKSIILTMALITSIAVFSGCGSSSDISSSDESSKSVATENTEKEKIITQREAANIAQQYIEAKIARGDVSERSYSSYSAESFGTINYGDASCIYNSDTKEYKIKCKGTCWGYDSYGSVVDKYKFDGTVYVDAETGHATSGGFSLDEAF